MIKRAFSFPISTLVLEAGRLKGALADTTVGPAVVTRLPQNFAAQFAAQITLVEDGAKNQSDAAGDIGNLTQQEQAAFLEMNRLVGSARNSAALAFGHRDARLRAEFQVGINQPQALASEIERAGKVHAACVKYATELAQRGWLATDATALLAAIAQLGNVNTAQNATGDDKIGITATRLRDANALYKMCLTIQNAAELSYPKTQIGQTPGIETARARFLLGEFPPHQPKKQTSGTPTTPTP